MNNALGGDANSRNECMLSIRSLLAFQFWKNSLRTVVQEAIAFICLFFLPNCLLSNTLRKILIFISLKKLSVFLFDLNDWEPNHSKSTREHTRNTNDCKCFSHARSPSSMCPIEQSKNYWLFLLISPAWSSRLEKEARRQWNSVRKR